MRDLLAILAIALLATLFLYAAMSIVTWSAEDAVMEVR